MSGAQHEQGPIRPPSEAYSLLLRVTRNCPWNRCEFCHIYKGQTFSLRTVDDVKKDVDIVHETMSDLKALSWERGMGGEITPSLVNEIFNHPDRYPEGFPSVALWLYGGGKTVFLQDANSLVLKTGDLVDILKYVRERFPSVERITTYARAKTVAKKTVEELRDLGRLGLSRIHIGLETGYDRLLEYIQKGVTAREHIQAGRNVKEAGISLSEYVMPGLGGKGMWREHATETAKVLNQIDPDFIRVRTLKVLKTMPLYQKIESGDFVPLTDDEIVTEERLLIQTLEGIHSTFASDHILNLLEEVEGRFPEDKAKMLAVIDRYLALPAAERANFRLGRRAGVYRSLDDLSNGELHTQVEMAMDRIELQSPGGLDRAVSDLMESFI
jgi:histone acetyltransferase (RNA polymerase elongator complex component)